MTKFRTLASLSLFVSAACVAAPPPITSTPVIDAPRLLDFPTDAQPLQPDLSEVTSNRLNDLHGTIANCDSVDFVLSTAGNYHMALRELWYDYVLPRNADTIRTWYYSTSPPIALDQVKNGQLSIGNLQLKCTPMVVVAPKPEVDALAASGYTNGAPVKVLNNRGNVLLVKKGNPKHLTSILDLGKPGIKLVTPNPVTEPSSFQNYSTTIYNVALGVSNQETADRLFNDLFNSPAKGKWLAGARIHHREVPWSIAYGQADVGVIFYHLALYLTRQFPDTFEIVPLGGTADNPKPLPGNNVGAHYAVRVDVKDRPLQPNQLKAREVFMSAITSAQFGPILEKHGLARP